MKVSCFFNGPYLGGAERSFILQSKALKYRKNVTIDYIVPYINQKTEALTLTNEILSGDFHRESIHYFKFNKSLFSVSRSWPLLRIFSALWGFFSTLYNLQKVHTKKYDTWWVNGNKIGFVCFIFAYLKGFRGEFIWHFRDYPATHGVWKFIWTPLKFPKPFKLTLIGNSISVSDSLKSLHLNTKIKTLYNPVAKPAPSQNHSASLCDGNVLGVVSMMAPWKGLHLVILFCSLYEKELKSLNISKVLFFGGEIYKTDGHHSHYLKELESLKEKLKVELISFQGLHPPHEIYPNLDLLIHSSLRPEPFGRVIIEAMSYGVPVVSSGLGGAGELISHKYDGLIFDPLNLSTLFDTIGFALAHKDQIQKNGFSKYNKVISLFNDQLDLVFDN